MLVKPQQSQDLFTPEEREWDELVGMESTSKPANSIDEIHQCEALKAIEEEVIIDEGNVNIGQENATHAEKMIQEIPQSPKQEIFPSFGGFESVCINVDEIVAALVSQVESQYQNPAECNTVADEASPIEPKTLSTDNLILMLSEFENRVDDLITSLKVES